MTSPTGVSSMPSQSATQKIMSIQSVDTVNMTATGLTKEGGRYPIDLRYHVGAVHVIPTQFEQWITRRFGQNWILWSKLPYNTTDLLTPPVMGQMQIGSTGPTQGPLQLNGTMVVSNAALQLLAVPTTALPDPDALADGALAFDTTMGHLVVVDSGHWVPVVTTGGGGGGGGVGNRIFNEVPAGDIDGVNTDFTTDNDYMDGTTAVFVNGLRRPLLINYDEVPPNLIRFHDAPGLADVVTVDYSTA